MVSQPRAAELRDAQQVSRFGLGNYASLHRFRGPSHDIAAGKLRSRDVVMALDDRMAKLEATVLAGNDLIASLWTAMEAKQATLERLEGLVEMEAATHEALHRRAAPPVPCWASWTVFRPVR
jgi:uncharacterized coiled-coil protein SlyX